MATAFICTTCGTQYPPADAPPDTCPVCTEERQYVAPGGQSWTSLAALRHTHLNGFRTLEPGLLGIGTSPHFAIGQRALLLRTPAGNVLWDCISLIDDATVELIGGLGGIADIAISHPHYYTTMVEWAHAFGATVHVHAADRAWIMRPDPAVQPWEGETRRLGAGLTLIRAGGHFPGGAVLHWEAAAEGRGALLSGDIAQVTPDRAHVSFMRSYPNLLPLGEAAVRGIAARLAPWRYDRIYGAFWDRVIARDAEAALAASVARYLAWIGSPDADPA
ncbi:MAG: MBL fold metallo-hydrolase [Acidisphaera sp.]|nr:MBL fold metallo-hydrolase [Acidisphaera sp.]